jgi:predicted metalloprotease with PDZ domain
VLRGGGPSVRLFLSADAQDDELPGEWVAIHEMLHLGMPRVDDAWMSEGLATYYQEVVRARAGLLTQDEAWKRLHAGFGRGRRGGGGHTLRHESREMRRRHAYMRVYWGGAAIALLWDLELRRSSDGTQTLDHALRTLHARFGDEIDPLAAAEMVAHLDGWLGRPAFSRIANDVLDDEDFPDLTDAYRELGLDPGTGVPASPSALRDAITGP